MTSPTAVATPTPGPRSTADLLERLGAHRRLDHYLSGRFTREQLSVWAALYPEEVPLVNGELPWIAATLE
jgi:hypothetical protein